MWPLFLGLGLLMVGNGLNGALIGVRSGSEGFSVTVTGVIMAGYFAGFLLAPSIVVRMISSVGHVRAFAGLASTASTVVLIHAVSVFPPSWVVLRFVFGFCMAGLYIVMESWLNENASPENRGRTLAVYMIVTMAGLGVGQYLITVADPSSFELFVLSSVLVSMSLVPVALAGNLTGPPLRLPEKVSTIELTRAVPTGVIGALMTGMATGVVFGLSAVYATAVGLSIQRTALFLLAPMIGGIVMQWPVGKLSDRFRRRTIIFFVSVIAAAMCALGIAIPSSNLGALVVMFGIGGTMFPLYSLVVSYTIDWMPAEKTVGVSGTLVLVNGTGALLGPLLTAPLMAAIDPKLFFWTMGAFFSTTVAFISYRLLFRDALPPEREGPYVPFPARATSVAFKLVVTPAKVTKAVGKNVVKSPAKVTRAVGRNVSTRRHAKRDAFDRRFDGHPLGRYPTPRSSSDVTSIAPQPFDGQPVDGQPVDEQPVDEHPVGDVPPGEQPTRRSGI